MPDFNLDSYLADSFESDLLTYLTDTTPEEADLAPYLAYATDEAA